METERKGARCPVIEVTGASVVLSLLRQGSDQREESHGTGVPCRRRRGTRAEAPSLRLGRGGVRGEGSVAGAIICTVRKRTA